MEQEAATRGVEAETLRTAFANLLEEDGRPACEPALTARAAKAAVALLDDVRPLRDRSSDFGRTWNVQDMALYLLEDVTGQKLGAFRDVEDIEEWRDWWSKSGADVERWLAAGEEARRAKYADAHAAAIHQLTQMHFVAADATPLLSWDPHWLPIARLEETTGYARYGRAEFADSLPARLANLPEGRALFTRDGEDVVAVTVGRKVVAGVEKRPGTWAAVEVTRYQQTPLPSRATSSEQHLILVWPQELGDLSAASTPPLDERMLAWMEQKDPAMWDHLFHYFHFEALVLDHTTVRRVRLDLLAR